MMLRTQTALAMSGAVMLTAIVLWLISNVQFDGNLPLARGAVLLVHRQSPQKVCVKEVRHALIMARTCGIRCVSVGCLI